MAQKAQVAQIDLGFIQLPGLMLSDGTFAVGVSQIAATLGIRQNQASRNLKTLLGKISPFDKVETELSPQKLNILTLPEVVKVIRVLSKKGNAVADEMIDAFLEESLDRRFAKAFDQVVAEDEYNRRLEARMQGKISRRALTDGIKNYLDRHPECSENKRRWIYKHATDHLYKLTHGMTKKKLAESRGCTEVSDFRSSLSDRELKILDSIEDLAARVMDEDDMEPIAAIEFAVGSLRAISMFVTAKTAK